MTKVIQHNQLFVTIKELIDESKQQVAISVNSSMSILYWQIGEKIKTEVLENNKAEYGKQILQTLSAKLMQEYGSGFSKRNIFNMLRFAEIFPNKEIVIKLSKQLSWSHLCLIIYIDDPLKREFYIQMCKFEHWSFRTFKERIQSMLYERTAISKKPEQTIINDLEILKNEHKLSHDLVFKDPYFLEFLGLKDTFSEKDFETSIIVELQKFIIELGSDFAFMSRQKRITIDNRDYYIDLLFYHRRLKCLVVIDLKIGEFEASYKGQMELYLRYLEKYDMVDGENNPIGLILCAGKNEEHVELMQLDKSNIRIADYYTVLPTQKLFQEKLHLAVKIAQQKLSLE